MKNKDLKQIIDECPKTFKNYKKWLIKNLENNFEGVDFLKNIKDSLIIKSITSAPYMMTYYFDTFDMIGSCYYNYLQSRFELSINGENIKDEEDDENEKENSFIYLGHKDRKEAINLLIKYLFLEREETL